MILHPDRQYVRELGTPAGALQIVIEQSGVVDLATALFETILETRESKAIFVVCNAG